MSINNVHNAKKASLLGSAVAIAFAARIHKIGLGVLNNAVFQNPNVQRLTDIDEPKNEVLRRIFLIMVTFDRLLSISSSLPLLISESYIHLTPSDAHILGYTAYHQLRVSLILGHISETTSQAVSSYTKWCADKTHSNSNLNSNSNTNTNANTNTSLIAYSYSNANSDSNSNSKLRAGHKRAYSDTITPRENINIPNNLPHSSTIIHCDLQPPLIYSGTLKILNSEIERYRESVAFLWDSNSVLDLSLWHAKLIMLFFSLFADNVNNKNNLQTNYSYMQNANKNNPNDLQYRKDRPEPQTILRIAIRIVAILSSPSTKVTPYNHHFAALASITLSVLATIDECAEEAIKALKSLFVLQNNYNKVNLYNNNYNQQIKTENRIETHRCENDKLLFNAPPGLSGSPWHKWVCIQLQKLHDEQLWKINQHEEEERKRLLHLQANSLSGVFTTSENQRSPSKLDDLAAVASLRRSESPKESSENQPSKKRLESSNSACPTSICGMNIPANSLYTRKVNGVEELDKLAEAVCSEGYLNCVSDYIGVIFNSL